MKTKPGYCDIHGDTTLFKRVIVRNEAFVVSWDCILCKKEKRLSYQRRNVKHREKPCHICGKLTEVFRYYEDHPVCPKCFQTTLEDNIKENLRYHHNLTSTQINAIKNDIPKCKFGVCEYLTYHHEVLKEDDQRLTTEFMLGIICGEESRQKYLKGKIEETIEQSDDHKI